MNRPAYSSSLRDEHAADTRARIVSAAVAELAAHGSVTDLDAVTYSALARRAGCAERTVYRNFPSKRALHDAVLEHFERHFEWEDPRVPADVVAAAARLAHLDSLGLRAPSAPENAAVTEHRARRYLALRRAVTPLLEGASESEARATCGVFHALTSVDTTQRLMRVWGVSATDAGALLSWAVARLVASLETEGGPWKSSRRSKVAPARRTRRRGEGR